MRIDAGDVSLDELITVTVRLAGGKIAAARTRKHDAGRGIHSNTGEIEFQPPAPSRGQPPAGFNSGPD